MLEPPQDERIDSVVADRYRVLAQLASGGMGVVYRAERLKLGRAVAMKFLHSSFALNQDFLRRFEQEAQLMSRLDHPHCVSVIDFGVADSPFIVMEFVEGTTLTDLIDDGPVAPERAIRITQQILAGLAHAHEKGIVHRDIKPQNIMLTNATGTGDFARILDFGLARLRDADQSIASMVVGTPSYMSPEQASGKRADGRADVYATGLVLFELLTGDRAFFGEQALEVMRMHREEPPPRLAEMNPEQSFSEELEAAVKRALEKDPDTRYPTPSAFSEALAAVPEASGPLGRAVTAGLARDGGDAAERPETGRGGSKRDRRAVSTPRPAEVAATVALGAGAKAAAGGEAASTSDRRAATELSSEPSSQRRGTRWRLLFWVALAAGAAALFIGSDLAGKAAAWIEDRAEPVAKSAGELIGDEGRPRPGAGAQEGGAPTVAAARELAEAGEREEAIRLLHQIRRTKEESAAASFLLGELYVEKGWHAEALTAYADAIDRDPAYRSRPELLRQVIQLLEEPGARNKARALILQRLGEAAVPALRRAARGKDSALRREAGELIERIRADARARAGRQDRGATR